MKGKKTGGRKAGTPNKRTAAASARQSPDAPPNQPPAPQTPHIGRPRKFTDPEQFALAIEQYFTFCELGQRPLTMHGLANALGISRNTLLNYENALAARPEFAAPAFVSAVKSARERVAQWVEEQLYSRGQHPAGPIFSLKNNFGWKDVQEIQVQSRSVSIGILLSDDQRRIIAEQLLQTVQAPPVPETFAPTASLSPVPRND